MRIAYIAPFDLTQPVGHTSHVLATVREMSRKGHDVTLLARACPDDVSSLVSFRAVPTLERAGLQSVSFGAVAAAVLASELVRRRSDVVYTRMFRSVSALLMVARSLGVPVVVEVNSDLGNERRNSGRGSAARRLEGLEDHVVFRLAAAIVAVTEGVARYVESVSSDARKKTHVIENGVDIELYRPLDKGECSTRHGLDPLRRRVVFTGAFQAWQGIADLVEAAAIVVRERDDVDFLLVGDGPLRGAVEADIAARRLSDRVRITGFVPETEVAELIGASDVCVAPYNTEAVSDREIDKHKRGALMRGSPLKIYAYLACGRPVVATHFREAGEHVEANGAGIAVQPERPEELVMAISRLLSDRERLRSMGERGWKIAGEQHSWFGVVDHYLQVIQTVSVIHS